MILYYVNTSKGVAHKPVGVGYDAQKGHEKGFIGSVYITVRYADGLNGFC